MWCCSSFGVEWVGVRGLGRGCGAGRGPPPPPPSPNIVPGRPALSRLGRGFREGNQPPAGFTDETADRSTFQKMWASFESTCLDTVSANWTSRFELGMSQYRRWKAGPTSRPIRPIHAPGPRVAWGGRAARD
eukprot:gene16022-biopygen21760